jgi:hypothetical protein
VNDLHFLDGIGPPWILGLYAAVLVVAFLVYRVLRRQWTRPGITGATRAKETAALAIVTVTALALVAFGNTLLRERAAEAEAMARLQDKALLASQLRDRIGKELDVARGLLADSTVQKIANERLVEARADLARFAAFHDPKIDRMIELIDRELEIRRLVAQSLAESAPDRLLPIYLRLTQLVPANTDYKEKAEQLQAMTKK